MFLSSAASVQNPLPALCSCHPAGNSPLGRCQAPLLGFLLSPVCRTVLFFLLAQEAGFQFHANGFSLPFLLFLFTFPLFCYSLSSFSTGCYPLHLNLFLCVLRLGDVSSVSGLLCGICLVLGSSDPIHRA